MGYSGYDEHICEDGHYFTCDVYEFNNSCYHCGKSSVWANGVDQTNDEGFPYTADRLKVKAPEETETCDSCGHTKKLEEAKYLVPTEEEMEKFREDRDRFYKDKYGY